MSSFDRAGFRGGAPAASQNSNLKNAAVLVALFACVVGFIFLFGRSLERVSAGHELTPAEVVGP
jgi:hypothetical protein